MKRQGLWLYGNPELEQLELDELQSMVRSNSFYKPRQGFTPLDRQHLKRYIGHRIVLSYLPTIATIGIASVVQQEIIKIFKGGR